jgi:hypothetical protein
MALVAGILIVAGAGVVKAAPGPNDNNNHGLCTAYFNGQKNGHDKNGQPGPFQALEDASREHTDSDGVDNDGDGQVDEDDENADLSAAENVVNYCDGLIGGNPLHGRYDCEADSDPDTEGNQPSCSETDSPGKS